MFRTDNFIRYVPSAATKAIETNIVFRGCAVFVSYPIAQFYEMDTDILTDNCEFVKQKLNFTTKYLKD